MERYWDGVYPAARSRRRQRSDPAGQHHRGAVRSRKPPCAVCGRRRWSVHRAWGGSVCAMSRSPAGVLTPVAKGNDQPEAADPEPRLDGAFQDADLEELQATAESCDRAAIERPSGSKPRLTDRVGVTQAPDMSALTGVLKEMRQVLAEQLHKRRGWPCRRGETEPDATGGGSFTASGATSRRQAALGGGRNRQSRRRDAHAG
jgi:hypothetical protein